MNRLQAGICNHPVSDIAKIASDILLSTKALAGERCCSNQRDRFARTSVTLLCWNILLCSLLALYPYWELITDVGAMYI